MSSPDNRSCFFSSMCWWWKNYLECFDDQDGTARDALSELTMLATGLGQPDLARQIEDVLSRSNTCHIPTDLVAGTSSSYSPNRGMRGMWLRLRRGRQVAPGLNRVSSHPVIHTAFRNENTAVQVLYKKSGRYKQKDIKVQWILLETWSEASRFSLRLANS